MKRKVTSLKQLAQWIANEIVPDEDGSTYLQIDRDWTLDSSRGLHERTANELFTLHGRLCRAIPNEFNFWLCFEAEAASASLVFEDGRHSSAGISFNNE